MHGKLELRALTPLLRRHPKVRVVIDHLNNPVPREATFLSKGQLDAIMGGTAERLWFG